MISPGSSRKTSPSLRVNSNDIQRVSIEAVLLPQTVLMEGVDAGLPHVKREKASSRWILLNQISFVLTGVFSTLCIQTLYNQGAAKEESLVVGSMYIGMALARFIPLVNTPSIQVRDVDQNDSSLVQRSWFPVNPWRGAMYQLATIDMVANIVITLGLFWAGSGIYQVIYASVVVFAALFLRCFMPKEKGLNTHQWISILTVTFGLALSGLGALKSVPVDSDGSTNAQTLFFGVVLCVLGTMGYASIYVLNQRNFSGGHLPPPDPVNVCGWVGSLCTVVFTCWFAVNTLPRWTQLVVEPIKEANGNVPLIISLYILLILDQFLHNFNYYVLIDTNGAVTTGVLQGLRSIMVFLLSALFFCAPGHEEQCLNAPKVASCVVVVSGVLFYSIATARKQREA
jgi:drug/metabolite transporter (DMT)-like permease